MLVPEALTRSSQEPTTGNQGSISVSSVSNSSKNSPRTEQQQENAITHNEPGRTVPIHSAELTLSQIPDVIANDGRDRVQAEKKLATGTETSPYCKELVEEPFELVSDDCSEVDTSSDEEDVFDCVNDSVRAVLGRDQELADKVVAYMFRLSPQIRAIVYQFGDSFEQSRSYTCQTQEDEHTNRQDRLPSKKRKQDRSHDPGHQDGRGNGDEDDQGGTDDKPSSHRHRRRRFACAFNIYDKNKYCPLDIEGPEATRYKSCAGPGFLAINHYK